jgi:hypothetical protein
MVIHSRSRAQVVAHMAFFTITITITITIPVTITIRFRCIVTIVTVVAIISACPLNSHEIM